MKSILIIDDDIDVRHCIRDILEQSGYDVLEAENGMVGLGKFRQSKTDLVIIDLFMPEKEGIETIIELRKEFPELKILAISGGIPGYGPDHFLNIAQKLGADRSLDKPFNMEQLLTAVEELIIPSADRL
ncbi:MAG TPA: response regulator [Geobacteraceae bacterium]|nr:response regulator [Geobacteraceae bacterium]